MPILQIADGEQRLDAFAPGLADPDEDPGGERHRQLARPLQRGQPYLGVLVRRAVVRPSLLAQPAGRRLEHDPRGHRDLAEPRQLLARHHPGVDVGQKAGLLVHPPCGVHQVVDGRLEAHAGECLARRAVSALRLIAQREQRLRAPGRGAAPRDVDGLVHCEVRRADVAGGLREGAVPAHVAAQLGEGDEDLGRVRHDVARAAIAHAARDLHQCAGILEPGERERLLVVKSVPARHRVENRVLRHGHRRVRFESEYRWSRAGLAVSPGAARRLP